MPLLPTNHFSKYPPTRSTLKCHRQYQEFSPRFAQKRATPFLLAQSLLLWAMQVLHPRQPLLLHPLQSLPLRQHLHQLLNQHLHQLLNQHQLLWWRVLRVPVMHRCCRQWCAASFLKTIST
jgi:hypothetical protein